MEPDVYCDCLGSEVFDCDSCRDTKDVGEWCDYCGLCPDCCDGVCDPFWLALRWRQQETRRQAKALKRGESED